MFNQLLCYSQCIALDFKQSTCWASRGPNRERSTRTQLYNVFRGEQPAWACHTLKAEWQAKDLSAAVGDARATSIFDNARSQSCSWITECRGKWPQSASPSQCQDLASIFSDARLCRTRNQCIQSRVEKDVGRKSASSSTAYPWREDGEFGDAIRNGYSGHHRR